MLMLARDDDGDGGAMSDRQLRDEALTIFLAGHETTANALAWTWHLLGEHADAERALHEELDRVLAGRPPTADDLPSLAWTRAVLAESMRLYPPAWVIGRRVLEDYPVAGHVVPAGALVLVCQFVVHRDARWWPEPERFDPERWMPAAEPAARARPKLAYFPFGAGPRQCIGEQFAWTEGVLVLATIAQRWRLRPVTGERPRMQPLITLRLKGGLRMRVEERS
jgi:cytochrome P450